MQVAPSLTSFVERVVELLRLDGDAWSPEYQSLVTIDEVFEREGIGYRAGRGHRRRPEARLASASRPTAIAMRFAARPRAAPRGFRWTKRRRGPHPSCTR
jgi:hypothetical protein